MKTRLLLLLAVMVLSITTYGQFSFGVSPGFGLNSAYFGYSINDKIVPFIGFQYLNAEYNYEESGERYNYDLNEVESYLAKTEFSGHVFLPNIGVKYFFLKKNKIQTYSSLCFSKAFITGKFQRNETDTEELDFYFENMNMWGAELGFGMEYFFDENFSLGGEFGLRHIHINSTESYIYEFYNPNTDEFQESTIESEMKLNMNPTFSKISLNFYF